MTATASDNAADGLCRSPAIKALVEKGLYGQIVAKSAIQGWGSPRIAKWIEKETGFRISSVSVRHHIEHPIPDADVMRARMVEAAQDRQSARPAPGRETALSTVPRKIKPFSAGPPSQILPSVALCNAQTGAVEPAQRPDMTAAEFVAALGPAYPARPTTGIADVKDEARAVRHQVQQLGGAVTVTIRRGDAKAILREQRLAPAERTLPPEAFGQGLVLPITVNDGDDDDIIEVTQLLTKKERLEQHKVALAALTIERQTEADRRPTVTKNLNVNATAGAGVAPSGRPILHAATYEACKEMSPAELAELLKELKAIR
jgi:hypothetical protein